MEHNFDSQESFVVPFKVKPLNFESGLFDLSRPQKHMPILEESVSRSGKDSKTSSPVVSPRGGASTLSMIVNMRQQELAEQEQDGRKKKETSRPILKREKTNELANDSERDGDQSDVKKLNHEKRNVFNKLQGGRLKVRRTSTETDSKDIEKSESQNHLLSPRDTIDEFHRPYFSFFNFLPPRTLAEQLTLFDQKQFLNIKKFDFAQIGKWSIATTPSVSTISELFNLLNGAVTTEILSEYSLYFRQKNLLYAIELMDELANLNNFHSLFAVNSAINCQCISRLGYLFSNLPQHYSNVLARCEEICSVGNGYATSRAFIAECAANNIPHIPWLGITQKNLVSLKDMALNQLGDGYEEAINDHFQKVKSAVFDYQFSLQNSFFQLFVPRLWTLDPDSFFHVSRLVEKLDKMNNKKGLAIPIGVGQKFRKSNSENDISIQKEAQRLNESTLSTSGQQFSCWDSIQKIFSSKTDYYSHTLTTLQSHLTREFFRNNKKECDLKILSTMSKEEIPTFCCLFELRCSKFFATLKKETFVTRRPGLSECPVPDAVRRRQLEKTTKSMNPLSSNDDSPRSKKRSSTVEDPNQEVLDARSNLKELDSIRDRALSQPLKEKDKNSSVLSGSTAQLPQLPQPPSSTTSPRGRRAKIFDNDPPVILESNEYTDSGDSEVNHGSNGSGMRRRMREVSEMYSKSLKNSASENQLLEKLSNVQITDTSIDEVGSEVVTSPRSILGANRNRESVTVNSQSMRGVRNLRRDLSPIRSESKDDAFGLTVKSKYSLRVFRLFLDYLYYDQIDFDEFRNIDSLADIDDLFGLWKISMLYDIPYLEKIIFLFLEDQMQGNQGSKKMYAIMQAANKWEIDTKLLPDKDAVSTVDRMFLASSSSSNYDFYKITTKESFDCKITLIDPSGRPVDYKFNRFIVLNCCSYFEPILKSTHEMETIQQVRVYNKKFVTSHPHAVIEAVIDIALHHSIPQSMQTHLSVPVVVYLYLVGNVFGFTDWEYINHYLVKLLEDIPDKGDDYKAFIRLLSKKDESELKRLYQLYSESPLVNSKFSIISQLKDRLESVEYFKSLVFTYTEELRVKNTILMNENHELKSDLVLLRKEFETFKQQIFSVLNEQKGL